MNHDPSLAEKVFAAIYNDRLIESGDRVLAALSGGADSVCQLLLLCELAPSLQFTLAAAHVNHMLRGEEADRDEAFVRDLCARLAIPCHVTRIDVRQEAKANKISVEEAGRKARYAFFHSLAEQYQYTKIATAHTADDNVETVTMRFLRGTGIYGLAGIPRKNGKIVRPLLTVYRKDIEKYLHNAQQAYMTDTTNLKTQYTRNRVRHELIPLIEQKWNPNFSVTLQENILGYGECRDFTEKLVASAYRKIVHRFAIGLYFETEDLQREHIYIAKHILMRALSSEFPEVFCSHQLIENIYGLLRETHGKLRFSRSGEAAVLSGRLYLLRKTKQEPFSLIVEPKVLQGGKLALPELGLMRFSFGTRENSVDKNLCLLSLEKMDGKQLTVRNRRPGDRFYPAGFSHRKKLQDFFIDEKIPYFYRDRIPLVLIGDEIAWVAGCRQDARFLAANGEKCLIIQWTKEHENE